MSLVIEEAEREKLFRQLRHRLGAPIRKVELTEEMLCTLLEIAIEDYSSYVNDWLIEHQWSSLLGLDLTNQDLSKALIRRTLDFETQFTFAYSKIVGLQTGGDWELKKDYVEVVPGQQVYEIPAGREINEVLWLTPPTIDHALYSYYGFGDYGFGGGSQVPYGGGGAAGYGYGSFYLAPAYDILSRDADYDLKQRIISSELVYKITAGPNGTKLLHLLPPPGSRISFGRGTGGHVGSQGIGLAGSKVWYHYYDTTIDGVADPEKRTKCLNENKDVVKLPSDVPVDVLQFDELNTASRQWVRDYLIALAKETLGRVRGKFGGNLGVTESEVTMDYDSLLNESREDKTTLMTRLNERLERLSPNKMLERKANEAEYLNKSLQYRPIKTAVIII